MNTEKREYVMRFFDGHRGWFELATTKRQAWKIMREFIKDARIRHSAARGFKRYTLRDGIQLEHAIYQTVYCRIEG